ncbi:MAG TPA: glycosyltransferase family 4 protein [Burkholderiaceae bacterium]|nr:glycosyltransferase family 4 protein [Burkholderiaceae bacterium]
MRILVAHNAYQFSGGEDAVVDAEIALLRGYGHDVEVYRRHNNELKNMSRIQAAVSAIWSRRSTIEMERIINVFKPNVIHAHNIFPLISPSIFWLSARKNIPILQTLHNFRLLCPQATFLRNGHVCEDCLGKMPWRAIPRKCYRNSVLQSGLAVGVTGLHRILGTYHHRTTHYIVPSVFCRDKFVAAGLPAQYFSIKPNFAASPKEPIWTTRKGGVFIGRLSPEKGLNVLFAALKKSNSFHIQIAGSGPLENSVINTFGKNYLGHLSHEQIMALLQGAQFLLAPSISYETFGLALIEAFACGTPVIASRHGAFADLVTDGVTGLLFNPGDAHDLAEKIAWAESHPDKMLEMGQSARIDYEAKYTPQHNYKLLIRIYENAINTAHGLRKNSQGTVNTWRSD